jgi:hypothetical protein
VLVGSTGVAIGVVGSCGSGEAEGPAADVAARTAWSRSGAAHDTLSAPTTSIIAINMINREKEMCRSIVVLFSINKRRGLRSVYLVSSLSSERAAG